LVQVLAYASKYFFGALLYGFPIRVTNKFRVEGRLVWIINTGKLPQLARSRLPVEPFDVAFFTDCKGSIDVNFQKSSDPHADFIADGTIRRNRGHKYNHAVPAQQIGYKSDSPDILITILFAEAETFTQLAPHEIAVQNFHFVSRIAQQITNGPAQRALSG
jgi:hypothetical protein